MGKSRFVAIAAAAAIVTSCDKDGRTGIGIPIVAVDVPVAEKVLGPNAISIDPFRQQFVKTPGIFHFKEDGTIFQICEYDTSEQSRISGMRQENVSSQDVVEDSLSSVRIRVTVLGGTVEQPYRKIKVSGYSVKRVFSADSRSASDWIISNVADRCTTEVLPSNRPYLVCDGGGHCCKCRDRDRWWSSRHQPSLRSNSSFGGNTRGSSGTGHQPSICHIRACG